MLSEGFCNQLFLWAVYDDKRNLIQEPWVNEVVSITYQYKTRGKHLDVEFLTLKKLPPEGTTEVQAFGWDPRKNWGLWEKEVVEVFFQPDGRGTYYEWQLSPQGQAFCLDVHQPRQITSCPVMPRYHHYSQLQQRQDTITWYARFSLLSDESLNQGKIGFYASLSWGKFHFYFSHHQPPEFPPDFHRPDLFNAI